LLLTAHNKLYLVTCLFTKLNKQA